MRVISKKTLRDFWTNHVDAEHALKAWYHESEQASWKSPASIKLDYPSVSVLQNNRVVFNIKGNRYRLVIRINYKYQIIWIRFIGTHAEYDKIDANTI